MITFTPLSVPYAPATLFDATSSKGKGKATATIALEDIDGGVEETERPKALAYLLELDDVKILIDCGGAEDFSFPQVHEPAEELRTPSDNEGEASTAPTPASSEWQGRPSDSFLRSASLDSILSRLGPSIDLVLLSHSTLSHLGSLAWVRSNYGFDCPIFATLPTQVMGRLTVLEAVHCLRNASDIDLEMRLAAEIDSGRIQTTQQGDAESSQPSDQPPKTPMSAVPPRTPMSALNALGDASGLPSLAGGELDEEAEEAQIKASAEKAVKNLLDPTGSQLVSLRESIAESGIRRRVPSIEQIEQTFEAISTLRYLQPYHFSHGKLAGITLTAYNAGHSLGGTVWKLRSPSQGTILVALEWNHNRERHLDGTALLTSSAAGRPPTAAESSGSAGSSTYEAVRRADLMITSIQRGRITNIRRKDRDAAILDIVHKSLQSNNSVLFPIDPSARLLELLVLLDQHWAYAYPHANFPLCLVSQTGSEVLERARTLMEWTTREWATSAGGGPERANDGQNRAEGQGRDQRDGNSSRRARDRMQKESPSSPLDFK